MITDKDFNFRCCWTCVHCVLDIARGYECDAVPPSLGTIPLGDKNEVIHKNRENCRAYKRG